MPDWGGKVAAWLTGAAAVALAGAVLIASQKPQLHGLALAVFWVLIALAAVTFSVMLLTGGWSVWTWWRRRADATATAQAVSPPSLPDPAGWIAGCDEAGDHSLLFTLRHRFDNQAAIMAFGEKRCTVTDPDGITTTATGTARVYQYIPHYFPGAPPVRSGIYQYTWEGRDASGAWHELARATHEVRLPALMVKLLDDPVWEIWQHHALIVAFHIEITNTTKVPVQVGPLSYGWVWPVPDELDDQQRAELERELYRRRQHDHYGPPLRLMAPLPARASTSGWLITDLNRNPRGGTPEITIAVTDAIGNQYKHVIPAQPPPVQASADIGVSGNDPI